MKFNVDDFNKHLEQQKTRSRKSSISKTYDWNIINEDESSLFVGYDLISTTSKIKKFRTVETNNEKFIEIVFTETPFYPEGGGQVGDVGKIVSESGASVEVLNTKKENEEIIHVISDTTFEEKVNYKLLVDPQKRMNSSSNHTATHLLHQALRNILGLHVEQKGSLVNSDYLRFDFSYNKKLESNQILEVENFVNDRINESLELEENREESYDNAIKNGVVALFGEKYGDKVRSIKFGDSYELCGGTHAKNTLSLRVFKILSEGSVASGIRSIEAIAGAKALDYLLELKLSTTNLKRILNVGGNEITAKVEGIIKENKQLKKQGSSKGAVTVENKISEDIDDWTLNIERISTGDPKQLRGLADQKKAARNKGCVILVTEVNNKASFVCSVTNNLTDKLSAKKIIAELAKGINGKGGGRDDFAQGAGDAKNLNDFVTSIPNSVKSLAE